MASTVEKSESCSVTDIFTSGVFGEGSQEPPEETENVKVESRDISFDCKFPLSIVLQMPKFSKGYKADFFDEFIKSNIGDDFVALGRMSFPNEWQIVVKSKEVRERLLQIRRTKLSGRTCWIRPVSDSEIRGNIHWLPIEISNDMLRPILEDYGEILYIETETDQDGADKRRFSIFLKKGKTMHHVPHFFRLGNCRVLITVQGRDPMCFHCKEFGHRKVDCIKFQLKMHDMGNATFEGPPKKRLKPRGKRHKVMKEGQSGVPPGTPKVKKPSTGAKGSGGNEKSGKTSISVNTDPIDINGVKVKVPSKSQKKKKARREAVKSEVNKNNEKAVVQDQIGDCEETAVLLQKMTLVSKDSKCQQELPPDKSVISDLTVTVEPPESSDNNTNLESAKVTTPEPQLQSVQAKATESEAPTATKNAKKNKKKKKKH